MNRLLKLVTLALAVGALGMSGCPSNSGAPATGHSQSDVLMEVGNMIRDYVGTHNKGPAKVADLAPYESLYQHGAQAVKSGDVVVVWGAKMAGEGGGGSGLVVAYEKKVPTEGGQVLLDDGKIKQMSADEFKSAPKGK